MLPDNPFPLTLPDPGRVKVEPLEVPLSWDVNEPGDPKLTSIFADVSCVAPTV
jgi:hypothetical protein